MTLSALIARYGLSIIFLGAALEGESVVLAGGLFAHEGCFPLYGVAIAAAAGSFFADQFFFFVGRRLGNRPYVLRLKARAAFAKAAAWIERRPVGFIFAFRFLYGLRTVSPIAIGASNVPARLFICLNALAAVLWGALISTAGYAFGHGIEQLFGRLESAGHILLAGAALVVGVGGTIWLLRRRRVRD
ncbi:MAG: DedA family protein [Sphingomonadales bacterium]|nr:DedA family protein [Sphingomonadales bacterium]